MKKACLYRICDEFLSKIPLKVQENSDDNSIVLLLDWISKHYTDQITLRDAASRFGYEYHYLSRLLHKTYRTGFNQLVNNYRIEAASEMLKESDLPITEIASKSGFQSIRNFNLVFQQVVGKSPKAYRNESILP